MFEDNSILEYEFCEDQNGEQCLGLVIGDYGGAVEVILSETELRKALEGGVYKSVLFAGGVAANDVLRTRIQQEADAQAIPLFVAPQALCGDNATMIGQAGLFAYENGRIKNWREIDAVARVSIEKFSV